MRKLFQYCLILVCIIISNNLFSQSFISENKLWRIVFQSYSDPCCINVSSALKFKGDSVINDTIYTKLLRSKDESLEKWTFSGLWRETKDKKVFGRNFLFYEHETLMYDFSLEKNDTFKTQGLTFIVDSVLSKPWGGKLRKHWYLNTYRAENDSADKFYSTLWIEDVGKIGTFTQNINGGSGADYLLCFSEDGQIVYQNPQFNTCFLTSTESISRAGKEYKVYPNPASSELLIEGNFHKEELVLELYSTKGELVKAECMEGGETRYRIDIKTLKSGIYFLRVHSTKGKYLEEVIVKK